MNEEEKRELIKSINEIRMEIGLQPYPLEHLESKSLEELRKLYYSYFETREDYRKRLKEGKGRFMSSLKIVLSIGISVILVVSFLLFSKFTKPFEKAEEKEELVLDFVLTFGYVTKNDSVFILHNKGNQNITSFNVIIDGASKEYEIVSGHLPLEPYKSLYFSITGLCDNKTHVIEVISANIVRNFTLTNECQTGSRI